MNRTLLTIRRISNDYGIWLIMLLAAALRFINLGYPRKLVFDETYYVKDAVTLGNLGYEGSWPADPNQQFESGNTDIFSSDPAYVVHPPLGKWIIWLGIKALGADNPVSWRYSVALLGLASVWLIYLVAKRMFDSKLWGQVAALLLAVDGHAIVLSRTGLLDGILAFFVILGFYFLLRDRDHIGLKLFSRPWLIAMAFTLGLASAVKWSGLYFLAAFCLYVVISDVLLERKVFYAKSSEPFNWASRTMIRGLATAAITQPLAFATYLGSWSGWLFTQGGYYRNIDASEVKLPAAFEWLPQPLQALWHYHQQAYGFHVSLATPHNYQASPFGWLIALRPTSFFYEGTAFGATNPTTGALCQGSSGCSSAVTALGNPAIWWFGAAALVTLAVYWVRTRNRTSGLILLGLAGGYLPWLGLLNRTTFQFYSVVFLPFTILAIVFVLRRYLHSSSNRQKAQLTVVAYLGLVLAFSAFFSSIWLGFETPYWWWRIHMWLPSWI
jgi:dolichyl-phosphate-mannose-protein mannosyltransferase